MRTSVAHLRERSTTGGWIDFVVFDARSMSGTNADNAELLHSRPLRARASGLEIDQFALAFMQHGRATFYGSNSLVDFLSRNRLPGWTHTSNV
jgi:hypothetical protein